MTTTATYTIDGHTFVAENGAPEDAAPRLAAAVMEPATNSYRSHHCGLAEDFCRANGGARLVRVGMQRGDADYHYDIQTVGKAVHVIAYQRRPTAARFVAPGAHRWECFWSGPLEDFLLAYAHCEEVELAGA